MWTEYYRLYMREMESKLIEVIEVTTQFISEYRFYILIGSIILAIMVIIDLLMKWHEKKERQKHEQRMKDRLKEEE